MYYGFLSYAGVDIINDARTAAYISALGIRGYQCQLPCSTFTTATGVGPYTTPAADGAPWYDAAVPSSADVAGFMLMSLEGVGSNVSRPIVPAIRGGGVVGPQVRLPRELTTVIWVIASSRDGMAYGTGWLARALRGRECSVLAPSNRRLDALSGCGSDELCMFTACPVDSTEATDFAVSLYDVGVTSGPNVVKVYNQAESDCGPSIAETEVVFTAGDPSWYSRAETVLDVDLIDYLIQDQPSGYVPVTNIAAYEIADTYADLGCDQGLCDGDLKPYGCPSVGVNAPLIDVATLCVGTTDFNANYYSVPFSASTVATATDMIPRLYYTASPSSGTSRSDEGPMGIHIRRTNSTSPCGQTADPCVVDAELFVPGFRRDQTGLLDWRTRRGYKNTSVIPMCPTAVFTRGVAPFSWPVLICGSQMCLDFYINNDNDGRAGHVRLDLLRRVDALA
jgi:hypothetical protein